MTLYVLKKDVLLLQHIVASNVEEVCFTANPTFRRSTKIICMCLMFGR